MFRKTEGSGELSSWIHKHLAMVLGRSSCEITNVSANTHSLKSVKSQSRKSCEAWDVENCCVDMDFVAASGDARDFRCRVSRVAMPNSLTNGAPGLPCSCLYTSRSIDTKTISKKWSTSLISRSPVNCSRCFIPPWQATLKFFFSG
jgi:hypothetical protein